VKVLRIAVPLCLVLAGGVRAQQVDPAASYRTVESAHFRLTYTPALQALVEPALDRAEEAYALLERQLARAPRGRIDIMLSDNADVTNGFASTFPSNRITVFVKPPVADIDLQYFRDWLDLVITHELAHTFHLDLSSGLGRALRALFGRAPYNWPFFPGTESPTWITEGLAVEFETRGTGAGRLHGSFNEMVVRTAVLEDRFDPLDRVTGDTPIWPDGQRAYIYGGLFMDYLARKHGADAQAEIARRTAGSILPPRLMFNQISGRAIGETFTDEYDAWRKDLQEIYKELSDSLVASGLTPSERLTADGRYAQFPRVSPDGRFVAFAEENGTNSARTRVLDLANGRTAWVERRNGLGSSSWLRDGSLLTAQLEFANRTALLSDLYNVRRGGQQRLTRRARLEEPDVDVSGRQVVAVQYGEGSNRLVRLDPDGRNVRPLNEPVYGTSWSGPRWSPDGQRIAVARWTPDGRHDIVVLDTLGQVTLEATNDEAVDATPAWSPDGRYVLFWSDRTGIPNLFAFDTRTSRLWQVSNVLTGAFHPDVSPDGNSIYFARYHADGFHIQRMPFDTTTWREATAVRIASFLRPRAPFDSAATLQVKASTAEPRRYRALRTLRPYYWLPVFHDEVEAGTFIGASTSGRDLVGRHAYALSYTHDIEHNRNAGYISYEYARLRNPTLGLTLVRDWDFLGSTLITRNQEADTSVVQVVEREDVAELATSFLLRRFRWSLALTLGAEAVWRRRVVNDTPNVQFADARDRMFGPVVRLGFANYRMPAYAISREDGIALQVAGRWRAEPDTNVVDRGYTELTTFNAAYKSFSVFGFAHHVLAARVSGLLRSGSLPPVASIGGAPGGSFDLGITSVGLGTGLLPVRGFASGDRRGTRAWTASLEYRVPLAVIGRGLQLWPLFLNRTFVSGFLDLGDAWCGALERPRTCPTSPSNPLIAVGAELGIDAALFSYSNTRARLGVGQPLYGPRNLPRLYLTFGSSF
jgi:Tol biopolymer transport system component